MFITHLCARRRAVTWAPTCLFSVQAEMDAFSFSLYAMLTLMSCLSLLMYLEQCVYIYRKQSYPKKTSIIWISGAAPVSIQTCLLTGCIV